MTTSTIATYSPAETTTEDIWLNLEQVDIPASAESASLLDMVNMYVMARSGLTAHAYEVDTCPATIEGEVVTCHLQVDIWPSSLDLDYSISASADEVVVGEAVANQQEREFDLVIGMTDSVDLPYYCSAIEIIESTGFYGEDGSSLATPSITVSATKLTLSVICFAVLRLRVMAEGYRHDIDISVTKEDGYSITNMSCTVQVTWIGEDGELESDDLDLEIPSCVEELLAYCEDGTLIDSGDEDSPTVYYSTCTGELLKVEYPEINDDE